VSTRAEAIVELDRRAELRVRAIEELDRRKISTGHTPGPTIGGVQYMTSPTPFNEETDERPPNYSFGDYAGGVARGGAMGAAAGLLMGGPVGMITAGLGGMVGEPIAMALEERGTGFLGQMGGSSVADLAMTALSRKHAAKGVLKLPGVREFTEKTVESLSKGGVVKRFLGRNWAAESTGYGQRQAGKLITDLPTPSPAGTNPAVEVGEQVRSGHQMLDDIYQGNRRQAQRESLGVTGSTASLRRKSGELLEQFKYLDDTPTVLKRAANVPEQISLREAENLRRGVGSAYARGVDRSLPSYNPDYKQVGDLYGGLDDTLDDIASSSAAAGRSVDAQVAMRESRKAMHKAAPEGDRLFSTMIGSGRMESAQKALSRILSSDRSVTEVKNIRALMENVGDDIALRRAAVLHILQARIGMQADDIAKNVASTGRSRFGKASSETMGLTEVLGERGFGNIMDILDGLDAPAKGGLVPATSRMLLILAGAGGAGVHSAEGGAAAAGSAVAAVLALGGVLEAFMRQNGRESVEKLAQSALLDMDIYRIVAMGASVNNAEAAAVRLGQTLVRRGLFTADELGGDD